MIQETYRNAVIVLGAGASRGARLSSDRTPPLDAELLKVASEMFTGLHASGPNKRSVEAWRSFKDHLTRARLQFKDVRDWRLEQLSTFLEARAHLTGLQLGVGRPTDHAQALQALKKLVGHVLVKCGGDQSCSLHRQLFQAVRPRAVVTFNYDLIADQTLLEIGWLNWTRSDYRGVRLANVASGEDKSYPRQVPQQRLEGATTLLKLHGSIHWERLKKKEAYRLSGIKFPESKTKPFIFASVPETPFLIPPVASKVEIKEVALRQHWYSALDHLHEASSWIIWGYSFPPADTVSQVLFKTALTNNTRKKPVVVVNPDAAVVDRIYDVCRRISIQHYTSMESLLLDWKLLASTSPA